MSNPCGGCPFRKKSIPGYTGDSTPTEFLGAVLYDVAMPCHRTIDYVDPKWKEKWELRKAGKHCVGAATFFANMCKRSRDRERPEAKESAKVFANPTEFAEHHGAELPFLYGGKR